MRKLSLTLFSVAVATSAVVACGSDSASTTDAKAIDAKSIDAKVFLDAAGSGSGSGSANYDFTCFGHTAPATAAASITLSGTSDEFKLSGLTALPSVTVETYKAGNATAVNTVTSDATTGAFATGPLDTGAMPYSAHLRALKTAYRTTYIYLPNPAIANLSQIPVPLVSDSTFMQVEMVLGPQDDTNKGVLLLAIADCTLKPIAGATATAHQGATNIPLTDLSMYFPGTFAALNVPDGEVTVSGAYGGMTFPTVTVHAYKKPTAQGAEGTITSTAVVPGFY